MGEGKIGAELAKDREVSSLALGLGVPASLAALKTVLSSSSGTALRNLTSKMAGDFSDEVQQVAAQGLTRARAALGDAGEAISERVAGASTTVRQAWQNLGLRRGMPPQQEPEEEGTEMQDFADQPEPEEPPEPALAEENQVFEGLEQDDEFGDGPASLQAPRTISREIGRGEEPPNTEGDGAPDVDAADPVVADAGEPVVEGVAGSVTDGLATGGAVAGEEAVGALLDATGIGAPLGVILGVAGLASSLGEGLKSLFDVPTSNVIQSLPIFESDPVQ